MMKAIYQTVNLTEHLSSVPEMEPLSSLLFELSNEYRMTILTKLREEPMRLSRLSEKMGLAVQETSRHLTRLSDACLIAKDPDGQFSLTPYGAHAVMLLPGFEFLAKHGHYFMTHSLSHIPPELFGRIGELSDCMFTNEVMTMFHEGEKLIRGAQEYILVISDQILMSAVPLLHQAAERGVQLKVILPEDLNPPTDFEPWRGSAEFVGRRTIKKVDVFTTVSDKGGLVGFPMWNGVADHVGFVAMDERARRWCKDLFMVHWEQAKPGVPKGFPPVF